MAIEAPTNMEDPTILLGNFRNDCNRGRSLDTSAAAINLSNSRITVLVDLSLKGGELLDSSLRANNGPDILINPQNGLPRTIIAITGIPRVPSLEHALGYSSLAKSVRFDTARLGRRHIIADEILIGAIIGVIDDTRQEKKIDLLV